MLRNRFKAGRLLDSAVGFWPEADSQEQALEWSILTSPSELKEDLPWRVQHDAIVFMRTRRHTILQDRRDR
jgi:hypothetical protein